MRVDRTEERAAGGAIHRYRLAVVVRRITAGGRVIGRCASVATHCVIGLVPEVRVEDSELRMVEDVETLGAELQIASFGDLEGFQNGHIEIQAMRVRQEVAPRISEGKTLRSDESCRVIQQRSDALGVQLTDTDREGRARTGNYIRIGTRARPVGDPRVVEYRHPNAAATVDYAERRT